MSALFTCQDHLENLDKLVTNGLRYSGRIPLVRAAQLSVVEATVSYIQDPSYVGQLSMLMSRHF